MRVAELQIQLKRSDKSAAEIVREIDPSAPMPSPLEGGDMRGPLYLCILKEETFRFLQKFKEQHAENFIVYAGPYFFDMDAGKYSPEWTCQWSMDGYATLTKTVKNVHTLS
jgi:hypothetical protein